MPLRISKRRFAVVLLGVLASSPAWAQQPPAPTAVVAPTLIGDANVGYPKQAQGEALVILELVIDKQGAVESVSVVQGEEPFSGAARAAALSWRFEPARRGDEPITVKIRFEVKFTPPPPEVAPTEDSQQPADESAQTKTPNAGPPAPSKPWLINVTGERPELGTKAMTRAEVRQLPGAFGDPFRAIEALPGVSPIGSGLPYFYVRGAPPGNVGYFFDSVEVPTLYHAAVGPSVLHPAFVDQVRLHPGPYPARYGRHTGGIVAAESASPEYAWHGEASVRLIDAGAMLEVPFDNGRGSAMFGGRYSYTAAVASLIVPELDLSYWDYQSHVRYDVTDEDTVSVLAFGSSDFAAQEQEQGNKVTFYDVQFHRADLRYDRALPKGGNWRVATTLGLDKSRSDDEEDAFTAKEHSAGLRTEFDLPLSDTVRSNMGADVNFSTIDFERTGNDNFAGSSPLLFSRDDKIAGAYAELSVDVAPNFRVVPGARVDFYDSGDTSVGFAPRVRSELIVNSRLTLLNAVGLAHQPPAFVIPVPGLTPALDNKGLQNAIQSSAGFELKLPSDWFASATVFQNILLDVSDALGVSRLDNGDPNVDEGSRTLGSGRGIELLVRRSLSRRLGGFIAYTLSKSTRAIGRVEGPSTFDRRHVFNLALAYSLGSGWRAGGRFAFYTGIPADVAYVEAARDPPRTPAFYRLDWRLEKRWPFLDDGFIALVFEVLNTTLHKEVINASCSAHVCREEEFGPVTLPSIGVEAGF